LAIYPTKSTKLNSKKNKFRLGLSLTVIFSFVLIMVVFNLLPILTISIIGSIGLLIYPLSIFMIVMGSMLMMNKKVYISKQLLIASIFTIISFILIIHLITSFNILDDGFGNYITSTFKYTLTAGGVIFSIITYPIYAISHMVGCYVIIGIAFIISLAFLINSIHNEIKNRPITNQVHDESSEIVDEDEEIIEESDEFEEVEFTSANPIIEENEDIFIEDEEEVKEEAMNKLGLAQTPIERENKFNYTEILEKQIQKEEVIVNNNNPKKPNIYVHNDDEEFNVYPKNDNKTAEKPKVNPNDEKKKAALEYLNISRGKFETKNKTQGIDNVKPQPKPVVDNINDQEQLKKQSENNLNRLNNLNNRINIINNNSKDLEKGVNPFRLREQQSEQIDIDNFSDNRNIPSKAKEVYNLETNENIVEAQGFRPVQVSMEPVSKPKTQQKVYKKPPQPYKRPPIDLLKKYSSNTDNDYETMKEKGDLIVDTLKAFKIDTKIINAVKGPTFTRYELQMAPGISVNLVNNKIKDLQMVLEGNCRVQVPIPGKNAFGIEVPNHDRVTVGLREIIESQNFQSSKSPLTFALGKDISAECKVACIDKLVHTLVAGSTGSGKSVCLNTLLVSLLYKASPEDLRLLLVDPKSVEFTLFNDLPHMLIPKTITECDKAVNALSWLVEEMDRRYKKLSSLGVKKLSEYNETPEVRSGQVPKMYYIVMIFDEVGDFMTRAKKEIEEKIMLLAAKSRACGIHLILATQRPTVDVITGTIKANLPTRISFAVKSSIDSKTILDGTGAEYLLGMGDMLYLPQGSNDMDRIQGCYLDNDELKSVINYIKDNNECDFDEEIEDQMFNKNDGFDPTNGAEEVFDPLLKDCLRFFIKSKKASASSLQAAFGIGYPKANKIVMQMEKAGFVSPGDNNGRRTLFVTQQEFEERFGEDL